MNEAFAIVYDKTLKTTTQEKEHPIEINKSDLADLKNMSFFKSSSTFVIVLAYVIILFDFSKFSLVIVFA